MPKSGMPPNLPEGVNPNFVELIDGVYYDKCVLCLVVTDVPTNCSIERRHHYKCGQLCPKCWQIIIMRE